MTTLEARVARLEERLPAVELIESLESLRLAMENGFAAIGLRLDGIDKRLDAVETRLDTVETRLDGIDKRLDAVETRLDGIDKRLDAMDSRIDKLEANMNERFNSLTEAVLETHNAVTGGGL